ncbi:hypothetical protein FisN_23Hh192 [Fistulifera solaris]|jgi:hypothetical protein|uniref:Uncharacterized protein n=1 Tax=Fistulifera solaris TaxID=1519565 RepID=A0A1Z5JWJ4_FISSO|nr:hypothetical protein FisN_23Hh192 [Fistulifera solaris]|eukprot:GAX18299.1 hypothetical protein FisN_23Hh192 [Fistulifera solaris]
MSIQLSCGKINAGGVAVLLTVLVVSAFFSIILFLEADGGEVQPPGMETKPYKSPVSVVTKNVELIREFVLPSASDPSTVVIPFQNSTGLTKMAHLFFNGGTCNALHEGESIESYNNHSTLVEMKFNCLDLFKNSGLGTGNFISAFYAMRMVVHALGPKGDVLIECDDAEETKKELILPWMMGKFPRLPEGDPEWDEQPSAADACRDYKQVPVGYRWKDMVFEMRRMAIAMVGIPSPDHPSAAWAEEHLWSTPSNRHEHGRDYFQLPHPQKGDPPLFPDTEIDDAVLHFRCGDIIMTNHPSFGFMKFGSFSRHISPDVRRIGIVTQPFDQGGLQRRGDAGDEKQRRCKKVVYEFKDHLHEKFPDAEINIWNSVNESIAQTFARMIMANQTVVAISSFGVFPGVTTFGTGYIREPDFMKAPNRWLLTSPIVEKAGNIVLVKEPMIFSGQAKKMWDENTLLDWFKNYD